VDGDDVAVGDDAADVALGVGEGLQKAVDVAAQALSAVIGAAGVCCV
jgi:hypothetical protein